MKQLFILSFILTYVLVFIDAFDFLCPFISA